MECLVKKKKKKKEEEEEKNQRKIRITTLINLKLCNTQLKRKCFLAFYLKTKPFSVFLNLFHFEDQPLLHIFVVHVSNISM